MGALVSLVGCLLAEHKAVQAAQESLLHSLHDAYKAARAGRPASGAAPPFVFVPLTRVVGMDAFARGATGVLDLLNGLLRAFPTK